jgi:uncharacterized protein
MFGSGTIEYTSAEDTIPLVVKPDSLTAANGDKHISLLDVTKSAIPPCQLNPLLFNGHLQTMWSGSGRAEDVIIHYKRRIFESDNKTYPGQFTVDFVIDTPDDPEPRDRSLPPRTHNFTEEEFTKFSITEDDSPIVLVMHGISGGSHEQYVRHMLRPLVSKSGGWSGCVINARGCAWSKITSPVLFNARATWDIRQLVNWFKETWPKRKIYTIGFSLGANILCNYLGEEGENCKVDAAVLVGNPFNLDVANSALESSFMGLNVYLASMGTWMKKLFDRYICDKELHRAILILISCRHVEELSKNPEIDVEKVRSVKYLYEWDRYLSNIHILKPLLTKRDTYNVPPGDTQPNMLTIEMHLLSMLFSIFVFLS